MKPSETKSLLKQLYYKVDKDIEAMPKVCTKGCFFCCFQPIEFLSIEKVPLREFILKELDEATKEVIKTNTLKWLDYFDANTPKREPLTTEEAFVDFRANSSKIPIPCPLLINGECSVYKARPVNCRTHIVNDDKSICDNDRLRNGTAESLSYRTRIVDKLKLEVPLEVMPLPYALVDILRLNRRTKRIIKSRL